MSKTITNYQVLIPTNIENLYKQAGVYSFETEYNQTRTVDYIKGLLVKNGDYPADIKVVRI